MLLSQRLSAALTCLAVVFQLLIAPLSGVLAVENKRALGFGGHCETAMQISKHAHHASAPIAADQLQHNDDKSVVASAKCCCGASAVSLASLWGSACYAPTPPPLVHGVYLPIDNVLGMPHWHWPKLNPRAPPVV